ncbi:hypothetical protein ACGF12_31040 [Kitasatospora sp. NPDC048296]|uniref:hypothetical protein n=1 Tax=Kitasatospora sp. NPDC048296 TaxID=3364048 RepID=UPI00371A3C70
MSGSVSGRSPLGLVWRRKKLLVLPGVTVAVVGGVAGLVVWAEVLLGGSLVLGVAGLVVLSFLAVFGHAALLIAAADALRGRPVGVRSSYGRAAGRVPGIAAWAPISAAQLLGAVSVVGAAWSLGSYLVVPAMVLDGVGVRDAMRSSRETYRRDRAGFIRGTSVLATPFLLTFLPSVVVFFVGLTATDRRLGAMLVGCAGLFLGAGATVTASLFGVFRARLYLESKGAVVAAEPVSDVSPVE